ncbi:MAG: outer-membrane lipoprotein carrier protein LolA [Elusimicrobiales bacterium]
MRILLTMFLLSAALPCLAADATEQNKTAAAQTDISTSAVAAGLASWDKKLDTLEFSFSQLITFGDSGITSKISGAVKFNKEGKLRIDHFSPQPQEVYTDKKTIWIYKPRQAQAVRARWDDWVKQQSGSLSGITDFGAYGPLLASHKMTVSASKDGKTVEAALTPVKNPKSYELKLVLSREDFFPERVFLTLGSTSVDTKISDVRKNGKIPPEAFEFKPPKGTDVLELDGKH